MELARALDTVAIAEAMSNGDPEASEELQRRLEAGADGLDDMVSVLLESDETAAALRLVGSLSRFCQDRGLVDLGRQAAERTLQAAGDRGTDQQRAAAWLTLGELAFRQGDQTVASQATEQALRAAERDDDASLQFSARFNLARIAFRDGDAETIRQHAQQMLEDAGDDLRRRYGAVHMLAWAEHTAGDIDRAVELFEKNVDIAHDAGHPLGEASELINLGALAIGVGDLGRASGYLARGLDIAEELDSHYLLPGALAEVGRLAVLAGRIEPGLRLIAAGERHYELAGLTPDPGDDAFLVQRDAAVQALGRDDAEAIVTAGRQLTTSDAIALARQQLTEP